MNGDSVHAHSRLRFLLGEVDVVVCCAVEHPAGHVLLEDFGNRLAARNVELLAAQSNNGNSAAAQLGHQLGSELSTRP